MDRLTTILPSVLRNRGFEGSAMASLRTSVAKLWLEREFPQFLGVLKASRVEGTALIVEAKDAAALADCSARSQELLTYVQKAAPGSGLESVRVLRA